MKLRHGQALMLQEKWVQAEPLLRQAYRSAQKLGVASVQSGYASTYGLCLVQSGKYEEAIPLLVAADEMLQGTKIADPSMRVRVIDAVITCYERCNQPAQADAWKQKRGEFFVDTPAGHR
jgi:hypothetical protein